MTTGRAVPLKRTCGECGGPVSKRGLGLGHWSCDNNRQHNRRVVTVEHDLSAGKENARELRKVPITRVRKSCRVVTVFA